jgi:hypothetical protein
MGLGTRHGGTKHRRIIIHSSGDNIDLSYCYTFVSVPFKPASVCSIYS